MPIEEQLCPRGIASGNALFFRCSPVPLEERMDRELDISNVPGLYCDPDIKGSEDELFECTFSIKVTLWSRYGGYIAEYRAGQCVHIEGLPGTYYDRFNQEGTHSSSLKSKDGLLSATLNQIQAGRIGSNSTVKAAIVRVTTDVDKLQKKYGRPNIND